MLPMGSGSRCAVALALLWSSSAVALHNGPSGRRVVLQRTAAASAAALFAVSPRPAHAARKGMMAPKREAEEPTCYGPNYEKVPCTPASDLADAAPAGPALAMPAADTPDTLDLNNIVAVDFTVFPGLYPTIGGKLLKKAPFDTKSAAYAALDTPAEIQQLNVYDRYIVIRPRDNDLMQYKNAGVYFRGKGGDTKRGDALRDQEIVNLQRERRQ